MFFISFFSVHRVLHKTFHKSVIFSLKHIVFFIYKINAIQKTSKKNINNYQQCKQETKTFSKLSTMTRETLRI